MGVSLDLFAGFPRLGFIGTTRESMRKIRIVLKKDGTQDIEVLGARGADCVEFTRELEERLGATEGERRLRPEYYEDPEAEGAETELGS